VRTNTKQTLALHVNGGDLHGDVLQLSFEGSLEPTPKYLSKTVTLTW
jgi:hypothetical protein